MNLLITALTAVTNFGANPGALDMYVHVPDDLPANAPVVVVMHGCSQAAADMEAAGWNELADAYHFAVVYPQQRTANNPVKCFNWAGEYGDTANLTRGQGENQSVVSMVDWMIANHDSDADRVFVAGFSAGGAFTSVLLATWPDRFAAGAIMSGLPYRCATSVNGAFNCQQMAQHPELQKTADEWGDLVRAAYPGYTGPRPRVQIWHGASDSIVSNLNQGELVEQWTDVFATDATADATSTEGDLTRTEYQVAGSVVVESYRVAAMSHAVCIGASDAEHPCGAQHGAYYEDHGTCSTWRAAQFFGLTGAIGPGPGGDDTTAPTVNVLSPGDGSQVNGAVTVVVAASDDVGVDHVELAIDGAPVATDGAAPFQFAWSATDGTHELRATAWDAAGNMAVDDDTTVTVTGAGGGGGGGGGDDDGGDDTCPSNDLSGCDAGGGAAGALGLLAAAAMLRIGRRTRRSARRRAA